MIRLHKAGDTDRARRIDEELKPLVDVLGITINPIPVKAALNLLGHEVGGLRLPLVEASEDELAEIQWSSSARASPRRLGSSHTRAVGREETAGHLQSARFLFPSKT